MEADGTGLVQVTEIPGPDLYAEASPDGSEIVLDTQRGDRRQVA